MNNDKHETIDDTTDAVMAQFEALERAIHAECRELERRLHELELLVDHERLLMGRRIVDIGGTTS